MKTKKLLILLFAVGLVFVLSALALQQGDDTAKDPVCGMTIKKATAKATAEYNSSTYYFCSVGCKDAFVKEPEKYLQKSEDTAKDPVCGMTVKKATAAATAEYNGKTYYFCSSGCKDSFLKEPEKYVQKEQAKDVYTCPMHPDVTSDKPGKCSKCGMDLVKKDAPQRQMMGGMTQQRGVRECQTAGSGCNCPMMKKVDR